MGAAADPKRRAADKSAEPKNCWGVVVDVSEKGDFIPESEVEDDTISCGAAELGVTNANAESAVATSKPKVATALENPVDTFIVDVASGIYVVLLMR